MVLQLSELQKPKGLPRALLILVYLYVDGCTLFALTQVSPYYNFSNTDWFWRRKYEHDFGEDPLYGGAVRDNYQQLYYDLTWSQAYTYPNVRQFCQAIRVKEVQVCTYNLTMVIDVLNQLWVSGKIVYDYPVLATADDMSMITRVPTKLARVYQGRLYLIDTDGYLWYAKKHVHKYLLHKFTSFRVRNVLMYSDYLMVLDEEYHMWLCSRLHDDIVPLPIRCLDGTQMRTKVLHIDHNDQSMLGITMEGYVCTWRFRYLIIHDLICYPVRARDIVMLSREGYSSSYLFTDYEDGYLYTLPTIDSYPYPTPALSGITHLTSYRVHYYYLAAVLNEHGQGYYLDRYCQWHSIGSERPLRQIYISSLWDLVLVTA